jgi:ABC-type multidrug transport system ATPase subunit
MIRTQALTKRFGSIVAVDHVDLDVRPGDRYGLLGPNGSGKTTVVRLLLGLIFATSGTSEVLGQVMPRHAGRVLPDVGALVEAPAAYPHLSGRTNLALLDASGPGGPRRTRRARIDEVLNRVGLGGIDKRPIRAYSLGMRQRLGLAAALLHRPRLLILDEPTNGLDPRGIRDVRDLLIDLNVDGVTVFVSSHLLAEVEQLCTRVGVMDAGRLVLQEDLAVLRQPTGHITITTPDGDAAVALLDGRIAGRDGTRLMVRGTDVPELNAMLVRANIRVDAIAAERRTLEDVVLEVTGAGADRIDAR